MLAFRRYKPVPIGMLNGGTYRSCCNMDKIQEQFNDFLIVSILSYQQFHFILVSKCHFLAWELSVGQCGILMMIDTPILALLLKMWKRLCIEMFPDFLIFVIFENVETSLYRYYLETFSILQRWPKTFPHVSKMARDVSTCSKMAINVSTFSNNGHIQSTVIAAFFYQRKRNGNVTKTLHKGGFWNAFWVFANRLNV